jgi:hypothetical protein
LTVVSMLAGHAVCQVISGPRISKVCSHQKWFLSGSLLTVFPKHLFMSP